MTKLKNVTVNLKLPYVGSVSGTWEPDENERKAAWELYVELATRVSVVELAPSEGLLREALTSLHSLFGTTRDILKRSGPGVAQPKGDGSVSFGQLSVIILNAAIRPVLSKWHPLLLAHESQRTSSLSPTDHEKAWEHCGELRAAIQETRAQLVAYADILAQVAEVPSLIHDEK